MAAYYSVQDAIDTAKIAYPMMTQAQALMFFKITHREIMATAQIEGDEQTISTIAANVREYTLTAESQTITQIRAVEWWDSATEVRVLTPTSTDEMDRLFPGWRSEASQTTVPVGDPRYFYIEHYDATVTPGTKLDLRKIGFHPIPDTSVSGGYPKAIVYGSSYQAFDANDPIPGAVHSPMVYVEGIKKIYASLKDPARVPAWERLYRHELHKCLAHINSEIEDLDSPRMAPVWLRNSAVE